MGSSHNLIFLHGWGTDPGVWRHQIEYFAKNSPQSTVHSPQITDIDFFLSTIDYRLSTILIGWSYGGMLAIDYATKNPGKVKALVLVGCSAKFTEGMPPVIIKNLIRNLNRDFEATMRNCYGAFFSNEEHNFINEFVNNQILPDKRMTIEILNRLAILDLRDVLKDITAPTLIIHGDKDEICPLSGGVFLHENIKKSRLEIIKGAGHMPFYTRSEEFNNILERFLKNVK